MRSIRLIIAVLLAASLAIVPMSAAMAMSHASKAEMSMGASGDNCPCCNAAKKCATDICQFNCFNAAAISVEGALLAQPPPELFIAIGATSLALFPPRPDPPPPRS